MLPPFVTRRGEGFGVPVAEWLKEKLRPLARDLLSPERVRRARVFNANYVARLQDEHERGIANHRKLLWTLLMFELWHESFIETPRRIEMDGDGHVYGDHSPVNPVNPVILSNNE